MADAVQFGFGLAHFGLGGLDVRTVAEALFERVFQSAGGRLGVRLRHRLVFGWRGRLGDEQAGRYHDDGQGNDSLCSHGVFSISRAFFREVSRAVSSGFTTRSAGSASSRKLR